MKWQITQKSAYVSDFVQLSKTQQQAVVQALKELEEDPITPRGNTIKKLTGYSNLYRYRLGDFRMIYAAAPDVQMLNLLAIGHRRNIYERFNYEGWDAPDTVVAFGPELAKQPEWTQHPEWFTPPAEKQAKEKLPKKLTLSRLRKWRIDPRYHARLLKCIYDEDLLGFSEEEVPSEVVSEVLDKLYPASVDQIASQPDHILFDPEDLARYAEGTLTNFLLRLDEQQLPLTNWALSGPTLVKGGPGSGKSTVALYRIRSIVEHEKQRAGKKPRVLFTTYTNALVNLSKTLLHQLLREPLGLSAETSLPPQIHVSTLHKVALGIVNKSGGSVNMANDRQIKTAMGTAKSRLQPTGTAGLALIQVAAEVNKLREDYLQEEIAWVIEGQNCQSEADYLNADRTGRGIPFSKKTRKAVWRFYEQFRDELQAQNLMTWEGLLQRALACVQSGSYTYKWDYVVVDEAQDFPPVGLALAIELACDPAGVFLTADANQSLYNRGFRWANVHDNLRIQGRTRILRRNYRSTKQIADASGEILKPILSADGDVSVQDCVHVGSLPIVYAADGTGDQYRWIANFIFKAAKQLRLPLNAATVLVPSRSVGEPLANSLTEQGILAQFMNSGEFKMEAEGVKVTTLHAAKGLEFPIVVIAHAEAGRLPRDANVSTPEEVAAHEEAQRRLFFVGCTRAMRQLAVTYEKRLPSSFVLDLSREQWDWLQETTPIA